MSYRYKNTTAISSFLIDNAPWLSSNKRYTSVPRTYCPPRIKFSEDFLKGYARSQWNNNFSRLCRQNHPKSSDLVATLLTENTWSDRRLSFAASDPEHCLAHRLAVTAWDKSSGDRQRLRGTPDPRITSPLPLPRQRSPHVAPVWRRAADRALFLIIPANRYSSGLAEKIQRPVELIISTPCVRRLPFPLPDARRHFRGKHAVRSAAAFGVVDRNFL